MSEQELEKAGRELCRLRGIDPYARVPMGLHYNAAWRKASREIKIHLQLEAAISFGRGGGMSNEKDGGQAFPLADTRSGGMTMRQYYKAAALHGMLACPEAPLYRGEATGKTKEIVEIAGIYADAMLAEDAAQNPDK